MRHVIRAERRLPHPSASVWAVLSDLPRWPDWDPFIVAIDAGAIDAGATDPGGVHAPEGTPLDWASADAARGDGWRPGIRWRERVRRGIGQATFDLVTIDAGPDAVGWQARHLGVSATHTWRLRADGPVTVIVSEETFESRAGLLGPAIVLLRLFGVRGMAAASLAALEARVAEMGNATEVGLDADSS